MSSMMRTEIENIFLAKTGLFSVLENAIMNVTTFCILVVSLMIASPSMLEGLGLIELFIFLAFNVFESSSSESYEHESFYSKIVANKLSIQYINFVNRLLPKHVPSVHHQILDNSVLKARSETFSDVTILFADICGFTAFSSGKAGRQVVEMLSRLFTEFDKECNRLNLFKLYTIGDCYVVMGFMDKRNRKKPAEEASDVVQLGMSMVKIIKQVKNVIKFESLNMRIGVHTVDYM